MLKVSIIVPVYNAEKYLNRCLDSIRKQTYKNIEVLLVDDGSSDNSGSICDEYVRKDIRFRVIHQRNFGQSIARNVALDYATGDYVLFVDADDYIELQTISILVKKIINVDGDTIPDVIFFNHSEITDKGIRPFFHEFEKENIYVDWSNMSQVYHLILMDKISNLIWDKMYKRKIWDNIRFPIGYCYEDLFIHPSLFRDVKKFLYVKEYLYINNRININSTTSPVNDFNSWNRYSKFNAYREHERIADIIGDNVASYWARSQAVHESIKSFYIDYKSHRHLSQIEREDIVNYLWKISDSGEKYKLSIKFKCLKWAIFHLPFLCKIYGNIRYYHDRIRGKGGRR